MTVETLIEWLIKYGIDRQLIKRDEICYSRNRLLECFNLETPSTEPIEDEPAALQTILTKMVAYASENGLLKGSTQTYKDLFDTKVMGVLTPSPSEVSRLFSEYETRSIQQATDWFYRFCIDTNYIRMDRIQKNLKWTSPTEYGDLEITINLSKPEKHPLDIAAEKEKPQTGYPRCLLCADNVGFSGNLGHPARQNLRLIPVLLDCEPWYFQYSPYVYYNEHCIVLSEEHRPMKLDRRSFIRLFEFLNRFPHYFIGSNADLPVVGGSILNHDHFQGGRYTMPMEKAGIEQEYSLYGYSSVSVSVLKWPMSVLRLSSLNCEELIELSSRLLSFWRSYSDPRVDIIAMTETPHNTITPIVRKKTDGRYEIDLVLRNNRSNQQYPLGIFHPHPELHAIKKENIGLIEVMGLAILPGRLLGELSLIEKVLSGKLNMECLEPEQQNAVIKHKDWIDEMNAIYGSNHAEIRDSEILKKEVGKKFVKVLENCGVFKRDSAGTAAFARFIEAFNTTLQ